MMVFGNIDRIAGDAKKHESHPDSCAHYIHTCLIVDEGGMTLVFNLLAGKLMTGIQMNHLL